MHLAKLTRFVARLARDEGFLWGCVNAGQRACTSLRSAFAAFALDAPGLHLGARSVIRGRRHISFGRGVHVGGSIWIEAVTRYGADDFEPRIAIGDGSSFSDGVHITCIDSIVIGRDVLMGSRVYISDHGHGIYKGGRQSSPRVPPTARPLGGGGPVAVGDKVWIGDNVVIVGPVTIGSGAVIGANSVVRHDVPANSIVAGAPARLLKHFDENSSTWMSQ